MQACVRYVQCEQLVCAWIRGLEGASVRCLLQRVDGLQSAGPQHKQNVGFFFVFSAAAEDRERLIKKLNVPYLI